MTVKQGYKLTEVGVIPEDWAVKKMGDIAPLQRGFDLPTSQLQEGIYPVVYSNGVLTRHNAFKVYAVGVVTGRSGTIGKIHYIAENYWPHNTTLWVTSFKDNSPKFIYYLYTFIKLERFGTGSGVPTLNRNDVHAYKSAIPPSIPEQTAIANALSNADAYINSLEQLIAKKQQIKQGTMQQLLTGKKRLEGFSGEWKEAFIEDIAEITTGNKNTQDRVEDGVYPFFVRSQKIERINSYSFGCEAVVTAGDGVGTGKVFHYVHGKFDLHQRAYALYNFSEDVNGVFIFLIFKESFFNRIMQMTAKSSVDSVRRDMIAKMKVILPPLPEQTAIANILTNMDNDIQELQNKLTKAKQIKQGMMQELLTGKTRLI